MACAVAVDSPVRAPRDKVNVKLFITSYTDEFFAERDMLRKDVSIIFFNLVVTLFYGAIFVCE